MENDKIIDNGYSDTHYENDSARLKTEKHQEDDDDDDVDARKRFSVLGQSCSLKLYPPTIITHLITLMNIIFMQTPTIQQTPIPPCQQSNNYGWPLFVMTCTTCD